MQPMRDEVVEQLRELNRDFYEEFAGSFAASRGRTEPGLERMLALVRPGARVLDLGCGHGRIAARLPAGCRYVGLDFSSEMLNLARDDAQAEAAGVQTRFVSGDLLSEIWTERVGTNYDWIILRAVLHHIPGLANRRAILAHCARLLAPEGQVLIANWQFLKLPRLRRRLLPWDTIGLTAEDVEAGDYLLDWRRDGYGLRYVHLVDSMETRLLAMAAGLDVEHIFLADGHQNNLTLYALLSPPPSL